jgi:NAD(P)-dependent dehydrogenase (short-subunit alcohol dehydrogenase family)
VIHTVITGGASGIGESLALRLARSGQRVSVLDRTSSDECPWWAELDESTRGTWVVVDIADGLAVAAAIDEIAAVPIDGLVTCAGIASRGNVLDVMAEEFDHTMSVNLGGTFAAVQAVARHLVTGGRPGSIVTVASTAGIGYVAGLGVAYHASKAAVLGVTWSLAGDLAKYGIRVNAIAPGVVRTPMTVGQRDAQGEERLGRRAPAGRLAEPDELAAAAAWLLSPASGFTTGHVLPVEGGQVASAGAPIAGYEPSPIDSRDIPHLARSTS